MLPKAKRALAIATLAMLPALAQVFVPDRTLASRLERDEAVGDVEPDPDGATGLIRAAIDIPASPLRF